MAKRFGLKAQGFFVMAAVSSVQCARWNCDIACVGNAQEGVEFQDSRDCCASRILSRPYLKYPFVLRAKPVQVQLFAVSEGFVYFGTQDSFRIHYHHLFNISCWDSVVKDDRVRPCLVERQSLLLSNSEIDPIHRILKYSPILFVNCNSRFSHVVIRRLV